MAVISIPVSVGRPANNFSSPPLGVFAFPKSGELFPQKSVLHETRIRRGEVGCSVIPMVFPVALVEGVCHVVSSRGVCDVRLAPLRLLWQIVLLYSQLGLR